MITGVAGAVDDMVDAAVGLPAAQPDGHHVVHLDAGRGRRLDGVLGHDGRGVEHAIDAQPPGFMGRDRVAHLVGGVAVHLAMPPGLLARRIVGHLGLVEVDAAAVAVPDRLILLAVLDEQAVDGDVVAVDDQAGVVLVRGPARAPAVIGAPEPEVVAHHVVAVDRDHAVRLPACAPPARQKRS